MFTRTKALFAATAVAAVATAATANTSYFSLTEVIDDQSYIEIDQVRAAQNGVVEIYDYRLGERGALLGSEPVNAGANADVKISLDRQPLGDVMAVLVSNGQVLATQEYDVAD